MEQFIVKHADTITGALSCFDRIVFKGYLPIGYPEAMERFLNRHNVLFKDFKNLARACSDTLKSHAQETARKAGRPFLFLKGSVRKEDEARQIARRDGIDQGLVCVFSVQESSPSFRLRYGEGRPRLTSCEPRCLCLYFYYLDRDFGLMHVRIPTWFPFTVQVCLNGHEWLARKMDKCGIGYTQVDNAFVHIDEPQRAQRLADRFTKVKFPRVLEAFARKVNPLLKTTLKGMEHYWVTDQAEYATDVLFKDRAALKGLYGKLLEHATLCFGAEDVLTFLGRKLTGHFQGEVLNDGKKRWQGARVKHRMKGNWIKMYDKHGCVLRIETVINHPREFRVRREGKRQGQWVMAWYPMNKGVSNLYRYAEVCLAANRAYLEALAAVDDPAKAYRMLDEVCRPAGRNGRRRRGLNPVRQDDLALFAAVLRGEHCIHGFYNRDVAAQLGVRSAKEPRERKRRSARVTRLIQLLHVHRLIAKIPRSRRWRVTVRGLTLMSAALHLYHHDFPETLAKEAA